MVVTTGVGSEEIAASRQTLWDGLTDPGVLAKCIPGCKAMTETGRDAYDVEITDYQCPYCKLCYFEIMKLVAEDDGIRLVVKDWPIFGPPSQFAARALLASTDNPNYAAAIDALLQLRREQAPVSDEEIAQAREADRP